MWMMPAAQNDSAISDVHASGDAKIISVIQNTHNIITVQLPHDTWPSPEIPIEQFRKERAGQLKRIWGPQVEKFLVGEYQASKEQSVRDQAQMHRRVKAQYCFVSNATFPELDVFDRKFMRNLTLYPSTRTTKCVLEILKPLQKQTLSQWVNSGKSRALLLDFPSVTRERSHWTTNFSMEIIGRINGSNQVNSSGEPKAVVVHFFDSTRPWTQQLAVRDFLAQLLRARSNVLKTNHVCGRDDDIYHDDTKHSGGLWELLLHSVKRAGIQGLYVIIDNFDSIQAQVGIKALEEFSQQLWFFAQSSQQNKVPVKILVTSRSPQTVDCFPDLRKIRLNLDPRDRSRF